MLERLFRSKTRAKLLKIFFLNRNKEFYLRELSRMTNENINSVRREVANLLEIQIIRARKRGNQKLFRVNKNSPIHEELRRIIIKTVGILEVFKKYFSKLERIKFALIYGSFASGEETEKSDVDLLIVGDINEEKILSVAKEIETEIGREVNYILWNLKEFKKRVKEKHYLLLDIIQKPFIVLIGDEDEFRRLVKR